MEAIVGQWLSEHGVNATGVLVALWLLASLRRELLILARAQVARIRDEDWRNLAVRFVRLVEQTMGEASNEQKKVAAVGLMVGKDVPAAVAGSLVEAAVHEVKAPLKAVSLEGFLEKCEAAEGDKAGD